jgi:hypothetical protein
LMIFGKLKEVTGLITSVLKLDTIIAKSASRVGKIGKVGWLVGPALLDATITEVQKNNLIACF